MRFSDHLMNVGPIGQTAEPGPLRMAPVAPASANQQQTALDQILRSVQMSIASAAAQTMRDAPTREAYMREVSKGIADIQRRFATGQFASLEAAAREAHQFRNFALETLRLRTSPLGLAIAKNLKEQGPNFNRIVAKYTVQLFGSSADFGKLTAAQRNQVFATILERAALTNSGVSQLLKRVAPAARGMVAISVALSVYEIATAEDKSQAVMREGAMFGAGIAGGAAGGAFAGLACGPGAPVCVTVGAFIGGSLAAFGVQFAFGP
jgi:hypothetical protein